MTFPIVCLVLRRETLIVAFWLAIIVIAPVYRIRHQADESGFLYAYFASFDGIAIGCCTALVARRFVPGGLSARIAQSGTLAGMVFLYLWRSIGATNVYGVTLMALGTAILLLTAAGHTAVPAKSRNVLLRIVEWFGRLSYEIYLFHLIILGLLRTLFPPTAVPGDYRLVLLAVFMAGSSLLSATIETFYSEPLNRRIRSVLKIDRIGKQVMVEGS